MSLTTLGSQLAGLNAPSIDPGSNLPRSRQHQDAVGRGLSHSVQLGHLDAKRSKIFKASILQEDAGKAEDVPLVTLKENCMSSLRRLELIDGRFGEHIKFLQINSKERVLMTQSENDELDKILDGLLHRLVLRLSDNTTDSKNLRSSAFHVIEYLLRRYEIHLHPPLADTLIRLTVPLHESPLFLRIMQIVDLSILPVWSFLRPYTVPGARVAREAISKQASIDDALLSDLCLLARRSADLPCNAHHLAFIATVVSECASFQVTNIGELTERTCHILLRQALGACRQTKNPALQNWGHVIASIIMETASLAEASRKILVNSILIGITGCKVSTQMNGLVVAFCAVAQKWKHFENPRKQMLFFLTHGTNSDTFGEFLRIENLSSQLGSLYCDERSDHVKRWIAYILVVGARLLKEDATPREKQVQLLILDLIREPRLRSLWESSSSRYLESFAAVFLEIAAGDDTKANDSFEQSVFRLLHSIDSSAFETGIDSALCRINVQNRKLVLRQIPYKYRHKKQTIKANPDLLPLRDISDQVGIELIHRVISEQRGNDSTIHQSKMKVKALLDLLNHDTNNTMAIEAGKLLVDFLRIHQDCSTAREIGEGALQAAYKWFSKQLRSSLPEIGVLQQVFRLFEYSCFGLLSSESGDNLVWRIIECLGAFSSISIENVPQQSSETLRNILGKRDEVAEGQSIHALILSDQSILSVLRREIPVGQGPERCVRRRSAKPLLQGFVEVLRNCQNAEKRQLYGTEMMEYCVWLAATFGDELQASETTMMRACVLSLGQQYAPSYQQIRQFSIELASIEGHSFRTNFSTLTQSVYTALSARCGGKVPWLIILMDMSVHASQQAKYTAVKNILLLATMHIRRGEAAVEEVHYAIAAGLCLLAHTNAGIRRDAVELLQTSGNILAAKVDKQNSAFVEVCAFAAINKSNISIGGENLLSWCLSTVMSESKQKGQLREAILGLCANLAGVYDSPSLVSKSEDLVPLGYFLAATILTASEFAGEEFYPLLERWKFAGSPIMKHMQSHLLEVEQIPISIETLIEATVRMLVGKKAMNAAVNVGPKIANQHANSCIESDTERFLNPYAIDMEKAILSILENDIKPKMSRLLRQRLVGIVVANQSWNSHVFASSSSSFRERVTGGILAGIVDKADGFDQETLLNLSLSSSEVARMIESCQRSEVEISYLSEYIVINSKRLNEESPDSRLISALFGKLEASLSSVGNVPSTASNYSCDAILSAVLELLKSSSSTELCAKTTAAEVELWGAIVLNILERKSSHEGKLQSLRAHKTCMALLESLCPLFPKVVVKKLIPAMNTTISKCIDSSADGFLVDCLVMILPQFLKFASSAGLFPVQLFQAYVSQSMLIVDRKHRISLYRGFVKAMSRISFTGLYERLPGAFVSACLSMELHIENNYTSVTIPNVLHEVACNILDDLNIAVKTSSALEMLGYAKEIISKLTGGKETMQVGTIVKVEELILLSIQGGIETPPPNPESDFFIAHPKSLMFCNLLLLSVWNNTQTPSFQKSLRNVGSSGSKHLLFFWQDLILVQTACKNFLLETSQHENRAIWDAILSTTDAILGNLHAFIPVPIFLAFAAAVIENGETEELRSIAVRSIADRAIMIDPMDAEATLFRETLPFLSEMVDSASAGSRSVLQQSVLIAIEVVVRKLCVGGDLQLSSTLSDQLVAVTFKAAKLIDAALSGANSKFEKICPAARETICIASLCASTCIRICGPRALEVLSVLIKAHTATLRVTNELLGDESVQQGIKQEARLMQVSAIHSIIAVVETLPQFLASHLNNILAPLALPAKSLREHNDTLELVHKLDATLVSNVPARLLIPSVLESISANNFDSTSLHAMVSLLTSTVSSCSRQNVVRNTTGLLRAVTSTLEYAVGSTKQAHLFEAASNLLQSFVLKLSEFQLRSLYLKLWEWKGDLEDANLAKSARRRAAFWGISAALAINLRTIYLPCLSLVTEDLIKELESAATILSGQSYVLGASETKRQRLRERNQSTLPRFDTEPVENALLCLEASLRSDAHDGGRWIREDDNHKYERLLRPLSKLLHCACSPEVSTTTYARLVQGVDQQSSSVVACIVSLAVAAGEEQLWKPLNHCVLGAASSETRAEVRKAGVQCLASLIRTIGEEYMIFIPECLPVLSELLEDTDGSIASLAQDCVTLSEEFLGENLQHSL